MDNLIEKRHRYRINHNTMVTLESLQIGNDDNTRMINYNDDGIYFESNQFLQPGTEIFIRIENFPYPQTESYKCHHAKVIWGKRLKNKPYAYGYGAKNVVTSNKKSSSETDSDQVKNLRRYPRKYCAKPATFGFNNKSYDGFISDISRNGCFIENTEFLKFGQVIDLVIPGTKFSENNILSGEVVRLSPIGVGVKFKSIIKKNHKE
jgi:Tfp pilus assembly protein PilZ